MSAYLLIYPTDAGTRVHLVQGDEMLQAALNADIDRAVIEAWQRTCLHADVLIDRAFGRVTVVRLGDVTDASEAKGATHRETAAQISTEADALLALAQPAKGNA